MPGSLHEAAKAYAEMGHKVFPCVPRGKKPLTLNGFYDATTDQNQIDSWWRGYPGANIGLVTGGEIIVIDIDGASNPWLANDQEKAATMLAASVSLTPGGGKHYFFRAPATENLPGTVERLAPKVDTRCNGNYVVVPPSIGKGGVAYQWIEGMELGRCEHLAALPSWLKDDLVRLNQAEQKATLANFLTPGELIGEKSRNNSMTRLAGYLRRPGLDAEEIFETLKVLNQSRCSPPLEERELKIISQSIGKKSPDEVTRQNIFTNADENPEALRLFSASELFSEFPTLREPIIEGLLRRGETMNIIGAPKTGKSWMALDLALSMASGKDWINSFQVKPGKVLLIDNELHSATLSHHIKKVADAKGISPGDYDASLKILSLRGDNRSLFSLGSFFQTIEPGSLNLIILDAIYRFFPDNMDENSNVAMAMFFNQVDLIAKQLDCSVAMVHHTSKGSQAEKAVTDVGAGAGAQSRAVDAHVILRPHEDEGIIVMDAAVRSWKPVQARCLRWDYPVWSCDHEIDPKQLKGKRGRPPKEGLEEEEDKQTMEALVSTCVLSIPQSEEEIYFAAKEHGYSGREVNRYLRVGVSAGLVKKEGGRGNLKAKYYTEGNGANVAGSQNHFA